MDEREIDMGKMAEEWERQRTDDYDMELAMAEQHYNHILSECAELVANDEGATKDFMRLVFKCREQPLVTERQEVAQ